MQFNGSHKVIPESMDKGEIRAFKFFLWVELARHFIDAMIAVFECGLLFFPSFILLPFGCKFTLNLMKFLETAEARHWEDIEGINKLLRQVRDE